jgi:hypothetical protein
MLQVDALVPSHAIGHCARHLLNATLLYALDFGLPSLTPFNGISIVACQRDVTAVMMPATYANATDAMCSGNAGYANEIAAPIMNTAIVFAINVRFIVPPSSNKRKMGRQVHLSG